MASEAESKVVIDLLLSDDDENENDEDRSAGAIAIAIASESIVVDRDGDHCGAETMDASETIENSNGNERSVGKKKHAATPAKPAAATKLSRHVGRKPPTTTTNTTNLKSARGTTLNGSVPNRNRDRSGRGGTQQNGGGGGNENKNPKKSAPVKTTTSRGLQAGLVLEEDIFAAFPSGGASEHDRATTNAIAGPPPLFEDDEFGPVASSIQGAHRVSIADGDADDDADADTDVEGASSIGNGKVVPKTARGRKAADDEQLWRPKCRCNLRSILSFRVGGEMRPYFGCGKTKTDRGRKCRFFEWAFQAELVPWYRFGSHNHHVLVRPPEERPRSIASARYPPEPDARSAFATATATAAATATASFFSARDLVQGRVGDCWFLSALAVVAERPDLVERLFRKRPGRASFGDEQRGIVRVNLFLDGIWTPIVIDNYLPCSVGGGGKRRREEEDELQRAIEASLLSPDSSATAAGNAIRNPYKKPRKVDTNKLRATPVAAGPNDPLGLSATNVRIMKITAAFLQKQHDKYKSGTINGIGNSNSNPFNPCLVPAGRLAATQDLAYSKARRNQLWVPFLEKAYAKIHGSYRAISGGHIAEAFLDLTGAPTMQIGWHRGSAASTGFSTIYRDPKRLWADLNKWRSQRLPMGCGTDSSAGGLIGMHAYSILDVREISNVGVEFFRESLVGGTLGNVSGFTEYDGKVRLLQVRNPHGQGEWKGNFSDRCKLWEKLMLNSGITLPRTMANDGTFWIGYDDFLLGFSNIDVVLAHEGNHAKSFVSNFPPKKSNHRCQRAFEVSLIDPQPGLETKERVEVFVMGIQKNRRGARQGRADRKKSYKVSDFGIVVGEYPLDAGTGRDDDDDDDARGGRRNAGSGSALFSSVHGQMFGFQRNGHYKLVLDRKHCKRLVVMPVSFGHPAATDDFLSFVVRFNADAPLMIRELERVPRMDRVLGEFLISAKPSGSFENTRQGQKTVLWADPNHKVVRIDCLGNRGGTVFVYLCAADRVSRQTHSAGTESLTVGIEATCRGMSCRVEGGLLDHETIAKGKKFEASWRKFSATFSIARKPTDEASRESRLLMVLYQSGQDTEMGSVTCRPMGHVLGRRNDSEHAPKTLEKYWKTSSTGDDSGRGNSFFDDYERLGVFHPVAGMDADGFQRCGSNYESAASNGGYRPVRENEFDGDSDLERALALSLREEETGESFTASRNTDGKLSVEEAMLQEAIERSCQQYSNDNAAVASRESTYEMQLEDALRRSRQDDGTKNNNNNNNNSNNNDRALDDGTRNPANNSRANGFEGAIDLTGTEAMKPAANSKRYRDNKRKRNKAEEPIVLDLTTADAPIAASKNPAKSLPSAESSERRGDTGEQGDNTVFVLIDSSDEEETNGNSVTFANADSSSDRRERRGRNDETRKRGGTDDDRHRSVDEAASASGTGGDGREKKRKLAAEAALKRLQKL